MNFHKTAFLTTLATLITAIAPLSSHAQSVTNIYHDCTVTEETENIFSNSQNFSAKPCLQETVETIYNPQSSWQPNL